MNIQSQITKMIIALLITVCLCAPSLAKEAEYARWVDSNGVTHYGSRPPVGVKADVVKTKVSNSDEPEPESESTEDPEESDQPTLTDRTEALLAQREQQCKEQKERLATLKTPNLLIGVKLEDGTTKYLTPEEIASDIDSTQKFIEKACQEPN